MCGIFLPAVNQENTVIDLEKVMRLVFYNRQNRRRYASFFEWRGEDRERGKQVKERSIVCDLFKSLEKDAGCILFKTVGYGDNPPDCVATDMNDNPIGVEVTELVDEETVKLRSKGCRPDKDWTSNEVIEKVKSILRKKSNLLTKRPSKYTNFFLVLHTDEPDLRWKFRAGELASSFHVFDRYPHIDKVYLLFSYQPGRKTYPYLELKFAS
jgi:hypothetical protein